MRNEEPRQGWCCQLFLARRVGIDGMSDPVVARLARESQAAMKSPEAQEQARNEQSPRRTKPYQDCLDAARGFRADPYTPPSGQLVAVITFPSFDQWGSSGCCACHAPCCSVWAASCSKRS